MPCPPDTLVRALFRDGTQWLDPIAAVDLYWGDANHKTDIIGWHPVEEQPDPAETHRRAIEWHGLTDAGLSLRLGELTAQEIRTVRAVLNAIVAEENTN